MQAAAGDRIVIKGRQVGGGERHGVVVEVRGPQGSPPYLVRWADGREGLLFPGSDAIIERG